MPRFSLVMVILSGLWSTARSSLPCPICPLRQWDALPCYSTIVAFLALYIVPSRGFANYLMAIVGSNCVIFLYNLGGGGLSLLVGLPYFFAFLIILLLYTLGATMSITFFDFFIIFFKSYPQSSVFVRFVVIVDSVFLFTLEKFF